MGGFLEIFSKLTGWNAVGKRKIRKLQGMVSNVLQLLSDANSDKRELLALVSDMNDFAKNMENYWPSTVYTEAILRYASSNNLQDAIRSADQLMQHCEQGLKEL